MQKRHLSSFLPSPDNLSSSILHNEYLAAAQVGGDRTDERLAYTHPIPSICAGMNSVLLFELLHSNIRFHLLKTGMTALVLRGCLSYLYYILIIIFSCLITDLECNTDSICKSSNSFKVSPPPPQSHTLRQNPAAIHPRSQVHCPDKKNKQRQAYQIPDTRTLHLI